jgi:hypothetical protein
VTTRASFTADEWNLLRQAPLMAALVVVADSPGGPLMAIEESFAVGVLLRARIGTHSELVDVLIADFATGGRQAVEPWALAGTSPDRVRRHALDRCAQVVALLDRKAGEERLAFTQWLTAVGREVAATAGRAGHLGSEASRPREEKRRALAELRRSLGNAA